MKYKKTLPWLLLPTIFLALFTGAIVYKSLNPYKPSIYNYQSYINPELKSKIKKNYSYKEYKSIAEFINAINNNKAIAGISTDYMVVDLINNKKISKINFQESFGIKTPTNYYTKQTNDQLNFFDNYLAPNAKVRGDVDGDGNKDHFWEYLIPVWINNKVFIYNPSKIKKNIISDNQLNDQSYTKILKEFHKNNIDVISWTNAPIENSVIGSENLNGNNFSTNLTLDNYKKWIDEFAKIVKNGTGFAINNGLKNIFEDDSDIVLQSAIDPKSSVNGAYLFNGDALDAYWSVDNFSNVPDGTIQLVKPKNSPSFIDGFVVSSSLTKENQVNLLKNMNNIFFKGKFMDEDEIESNVKNGEEIDWKKLASLSNFDFVNFTPTSKGEYYFVLHNYFNSDEKAKEFYKINKINPIVPINQELQSSVIAYFKRKLRS